MRMQRVGIVLASFVTVALAGCCDGTRGYGPRDGEVGGSGSRPANHAEADATCVPFCHRLVGCGTVTPEKEPDCLSFCGTQLEANPELTASGCSCVERDSCRPPDHSNGEYNCPGAPIPPPDYSAPDAGSTCRTYEWIGSDGGCRVEHECDDGSFYYSDGCPATSSGGSTGTTGSSGSTGASGSTGSTGSSGTTGSACERNLDCAYNEDCVGGACLTRCHASCECASGQACLADGYCHGSVPPPASCQVDCECNAGQHCVSGFCQ